MGQVVIHKPHVRLGLAKMLHKSCPSGFLVPHAGKVPRGIKYIEITDGPTGCRKEFQVVPVNGSGCLPAETYFVQSLRSGIRKLQASVNRQFREACVVLHPADPLFRYGEEQLSIAHDARRRIMHLRIVDPQCDHGTTRIPVSFGWLIANTWPACISVAANLRVLSSLYSCVLDCRLLWVVQGPYGSWLAV